MNKAHNNNLLASIAVFTELCNNGKDFKNIISEFIKAVFAFQKKWDIDSTEAKQYLKEDFDFDLPEAVVRTCLNSLKTKGFLERKLARYFVVDQSYNANELIEKLRLKKENQSTIENELVAYCESVLAIKLNEDEKGQLAKDFVSYLLDNGVSDKYSVLISSFVIENTNNKNIVDSLNAIKEGLVLITGLSHTEDINNIGFWNEELTIYLDTEHLFNCAGYNGEVFKRMFEDLFLLVRDINEVHRKKNGKNLIHLKYFQEAYNEVHSFFYIAKKIVNREDNASPDNAAMQAICSGCTETSDVIRKQVLFDSDLKGRGILLQEDLDYYSKPQYNIEDEDLLEKFNGQFDEDTIANILRSFTRINFLRKGVNRTSFERCKHIILSGKYATRYISRDLEVKNQAKDIPFATDIEFVTNRLWFRQNKGLSHSWKLPATLDIVAKAQIALSSQVNRSVAKRYEELKSELENGKINKQQAQDYYSSLRENAKRPEEINIDTVEVSMKFIFEGDLDKYQRESSLLKERVEKGAEAIAELDRIKKELRDDTRTKKKQLIRNKRGAILVIIALIFCAVVTGFILFLLAAFEKFRSPNDTVLSVVGLYIGCLLTFILGVWPIINFKKLNSFLAIKLKKEYKEELQSSLNILDK